MDHRPFDRFDRRFGFNLLEVDPLLELLRDQVDSQLAGLLARTSVHPSISDQEKPALGSMKQLSSLLSRKLPVKLTWPHFSET